MHRPDLLKDVLNRPVDPAWLLHEEGYEPALEHEVESRFAVGNGFLGVRGSLEQPTEASRPRTYVAGLFFAPESAPSVAALVSAPDWLRIHLAVNGEPLSVESGHTLEHSRTLDLERGVLVSRLTQRMESGIIVTFRALRFASHSQRSTVVQLASVEVQQPARLQLQAGLGPAEEVLEASGNHSGVAFFHIAGREDMLAVSAKTSLRVGGRLLAGSGTEPGPARWSWDAGPADTASFSRAVTIVRVGAHEMAARRAAGGLAADRPVAIRRLYARHLAAWRKRWAESDVLVTGDDASQKALRFAMYHLMSAANPDDEHVSVGARALTGDAYKGHVFWDTEIFLLPFYTLTWPAAARAMLMYRYHTLPAARAKAERLGYRGALYAWESAETGEETTPPYALGPQGQVIPIRCGAIEHHISADIAYAVWQYWQATGDTTYLLEAGAEILLETSRFWASRSRLEGDGHYHIRGVIGPDEYHEDVDDNAYTNLMGAYNIACGLKVAGMLRRRWPDRWAELEGRLALNEEELALWGRVRDRMFTGFDPRAGLFEQFAGFFSLEEVDLKAYADRTAPMDVVLGPERTRRSQVVKQADVVMLMALRGSSYERRIQQANFAYYQQRTGHGSSLSPPAHAVVAARLGHVDLAKRLFDETAAIDLDDTMGNAAGGVHIGALGGLWQAAVFGFAGFQATDAGLRFDPHLPAGWKSLKFPIRWRRRLVRVVIEAEPLSVKVTLEHGRPVQVQVGGAHQRIHRGQTWRCQWHPDDAWQEATHDLQRR